MMRMFTVKSMLVVVALTAAASAQVRNGSFNSPRTLKADDPHIVDVTKAKWTLPADLILPADWLPVVATPGGTLEYIRNGGWMGSAYVRLNGGGHIASYFGGLVPGKPYVGSLWVRGKGEIWFGAYEYDEAGQTGGATFVSRPVASEKWVEYRGLYPNTNQRVTAVNLAVAGKGPVDVDEVRFAPADPADVEITKEMVGLYGTGALIEDPEIQAIRVDDAYNARLGEYEATLIKLRQDQAKVDKTVFDSLEKKAAVLAPYLQDEGKTSVIASYHNEMIALTRALKRLTGTDPGPAAAVKVEPMVSALGYKPGERAARPDAVTVIDVRSDKVRYDENATATTVAKIVNTTATEQKGTLDARMILDLDTVRELSRTAFTIPAGQTQEWRFSYNVGPETYGRAIEVQWVDVKGKVIDKWQEFYGVAAEWFRIQQHSNNGPMKSYSLDPHVTYWNMTHMFASEPTDWGVQADPCANLEEYLSGQPLYHLGMPARRAQYAALKSQHGIMGTFYQNMSYNGQMGYEVIRQNLEFALYGPNGQFAVDPVYGGYPNPFELASPMEIGPKRKVQKPYLDRRLSSWQHGMVNLAREDVVRYMAERIKEQAKFLNAEGIYIDGNVGIWAGYAYDGKPNVPGGKAEDYAELNARNHNLFSEILKKDNPNFGTFYNWAFSYLEWFIGQGFGAAYLGSGTGLPGDPNDKNVTAAAGWRNVMFLDEANGQFSDGDSPVRYPDQQLDRFCDNRDYLVQRYGANVMIGYIGNFTISHDVPGPDRWGWATLNYFGAQLIATQHHFFTWWVPSVRPTSQFWARYSRLIWAPDIKVVPEAEKQVTVTAPAKEIWWKRLVYRRERADGYDLIVHLVRIPPTPKWDLTWLDEPVPLTEVKLSVNLDQGTLKDVQAMRPYYFEEAQQPVQRTVEAKITDGRAEITVPEFRYHTMVVFRFAK